jgi:hypothetical protein
MLDAICCQIQEVGRGLTNQSMLSLHLNYLVQAKMVLRKVIKIIVIIIIVIIIIVVIIIFIIFIIIIVIVIITIIFAV